MKCLRDRIRRLKCDEQKPVCKRCSSTGRHCDGYFYAPAALRLDAESISSPSAKSTSSPSLVYLLRQPLPAMAPAGVRWTPQQLNMFEIFRSQTISQMLGGFDRGSWTLDVLRATNKYPAIWHAGLALAALYERGKMATLSEDFSDTLSSDDTRRRCQELLTFALTQYNESIRCLVHSTAQTTPSASDQEMLLMASMLFTGICCLQGDMRQGLLHARSGLHLFNQWRFWERANGAMYAGERPVCPTERPVDDQDCLMSADSLVTLITHVECLFVNNLGVPNTPTVIPQACSDAPFLSLTDAYFEFQPLLTGLLDFCQSIAASPDVIPPIESASGNNNSSAGSTLVEWSANPFPPADIRREYRRELRVWQDKFANLHRLLPAASPDEHMQHAILMLRMCWKGVDICLDVDLANVELAYDNYQSTFADILSLAEELCHLHASSIKKRDGKSSNRSAKRSCNLSASDTADSGAHNNKGISPVKSYAMSACELLCFVCRTCRDTPLRERAASLLRRWPRNDGLWDGRLLTSICEAMTAAEQDPGGSKMSCVLCAPGARSCGHLRVARTDLEFQANGDTNFTLTTVGQVRQGRLGQFMKLPT